MIMTLLENLTYGNRIWTLKNSELSEGEIISLPSHGHINTYEGGVSVASIAPANRDALENFLD